MKHQYKEYYDNQEILVAKDHEQSYGLPFPIHTNGKYGS